MIPCSVLDTVIRRAIVVMNDMPLISGLTDADCERCAPCCKLN